MPPNIQNIYHVIVYTCRSDYNGVPVISPGACYDTSGITVSYKSFYCQTVSLT